MKPRCIKLLTQQALRFDRPLSTQYGGIVGISLFGPRAIDAFLLPLARDYWETWNAELKQVMAVKEKRDVMKEYELHMCQQALLVSYSFIVFVQHHTFLFQSLTTSNCAFVRRMQLEYSCKMYLRKNWPSEWTWQPFQMFSGKNSFHCNGSSLAILHLFFSSVILVEV